MTSRGLLVLTVLACGGAARAEDDVREMPMIAVERALGAPRASGLLVVALAPEGQAVEQGITPGTILTAYGGANLGSVEALRAAMGATAPDAASVDVACVAPDGTERTVSLRPGPIGIADLRPVCEGEAAPALPEDSGVSFSFVRVVGPDGEWYRFLLGGKHVGFERGTCSISDATFSCEREVAFDGGERWGVNRMAVEAVVHWGRTVVPWSTTYTNLVNGWRGEGHRGQGEESTRWDVAWHHAPDSVERFAWRLPGDLPLVPTYLVEYLARVMPREEGACFRYRPLEEGMGQAGLPCALVVAGPDAIEIAGETLDTWRVEQRQLGAQDPVRYWIDAAQRARRIDYRGGAVAELAASREEALAGLPPALAPRTAPER